MVIVEFFRDVLDGIWYYLYLLGCILAFFFVLGIVADRKRYAINDKLKEKKKYDIESGREAEIAAMESKQVLAVDKELDPNQPVTGATVNDLTKANSNVDGLKKEGQEEVPAVMVLNSTETSTEQTTPAVAPSPAPAAQVAQPAATVVVSQEQTPEQKQEEPLVINS